MSYIEAAFDRVCKKARPADGWYVTLMESVPYYGGPEEGGWWGSDEEVIRYQYYNTKEKAKAAYRRVEKLAKRLERDAEREYGEQCLREMDQLESRGLEATDMPEPDGPSKFHVVLSKGVPEGQQGTRGYS